MTESAIDLSMQV